jgi:hypothetical protein
MIVKVQSMKIKRGGQYLVLTNIISSDRPSTQDGVDRLIQAEPARCVAGAGLFSWLHSPGLRYDTHFTTPPSSISKPSVDPS